MVLCPPDLAAEHLPYVIETAEIDAVVVDPGAEVLAAAADLPHLRCDPDRPIPAAVPVQDAVPTEWVLFTSGTTGRPKMVLHDLATLSAPIMAATAIENGEVWSTFYDIRRYGGLQILLRALLGGGSMVLSDAAEPVAGFLARAAREGVTHISGTPSHWRRALMSPAARSFAPLYVRLSGEVADQPVLDRLATAFPSANIAHAFASTEAGVAFSIADGHEGFPAALLHQSGAVEMRVQDGSLRLRSNRLAMRYLGDNAPRLEDSDGFVDTGDMVELRGDRYHFVGRREGIINVGGLKVHPEEVESVLNSDPRVQMSRVRARKSPITGAIVTADIVLSDAGRAAPDANAVTQDIIDVCRRLLPAHKAPASVRVVEALDVLPTGKLARRVA